MEFQTLKGSRSKKIVMGIIVFITIINIVMFGISHSSYRTTQSVNVAHGVINYKMPDLNIIAVKVQKDDTSTDESNYDSADSIPTGRYILNTTKSYCTYSNNGQVTNINTNMSYDSETGIVDIGISKKGTKCYLYFDIIVGKSASDIIVDATNCSTASMSYSSGYTGTVSGAVTSGSYICKISDGMYTSGGTYGDGYTYVFRGATTNNWVNFAGMYWRIIRVNGDGSIRMIYSGTTAPTESQAVVMTGTGTQVATSAINSSYNDATYVGWYYSTSVNHPTSSAGTSSTIRDYLLKDTTGWYYSSGLSSYATKIADGKFCNDRTPVTNYFSGFTNSNTYGTSQTAFVPAARVYNTSWSWNSPQTFVTSCSNTNDIFSEKVGLVTLDEILMIGGYVGTENLDYYLYTNLDYWTMTPSHRGSVAAAFNVCSNGAVTSHGYSVKEQYGVRPVINLNANVTLSGDGTYGSPYTIN